MRQTRWMRGLNIGGLLLCMTIFYVIMLIPLLSNLQEDIRETGRGFETVRQYFSARDVQPPRVEEEEEEEEEEEQQKQQKQEQQQEQTWQQVSGSTASELPDLEEPVAVETKEETEQDEDEPPDTSEYTPIAAPDDVSARRLRAIRNAFIHAWNGYETWAWGSDELKPLTNGTVTWLGGSGLWIVEALGTAHIMGLSDLVERASTFIERDMVFQRPKASFFESTIRLLGGLCSAYSLTGKQDILTRAEEVGSRLLRAFNQANNIPTGTADLTGRTPANKFMGQARMPLSEATVPLEFTMLSLATGDQTYAEKAATILGLTEVDPTCVRQDGLCPVYFNHRRNSFSGEVKFGALGDSYYEYVLKTWILSGKKVQALRDLYDRSISGLKKHLIFTNDDGITYIADDWWPNGDRHNHKMDHLTCFAGGMLALGAEGPHAEEDMNLAKQLTHACYEMYTHSPTKLAAEITNFKPHVRVGPTAVHNLLRPETVESLFVLWRKTHDPIYREWGWEIFQAFEEHTKVESGYASLKDVRQVPPPKDDSSPSYFVAETLKYLYLLFSDDSVLPLDEYVFNTEAHPFRIPTHSDPPIEEAILRGIEAGRRLSGAYKGQ